MNLPLTILGFLASCALPACRAFVNGDFESGSYGPGVPAYWKGNAGDGSMPVLTPTPLSPFTNIYPPGASAIVFKDGVGDSNFPNLAQPWSPSSARMELTFDFCVDAVSNAPWKVSLGDSTKSLAFHINAAGGFVYSADTGAMVMSLTAGKWYQLRAVVDTTTHTFSGSLTEFGGPAVQFSGALPSGPLINQLVIQDFSASQSPDLHMDNVSLRSVPEPRTWAVLGCGISLLLARRSRLRMIPSNHLSK
jgi:hypothetical protein